MATSKRKIKGRRESLSAEYRVLDRPRRGLKLIDENIFSQRAAAAVVDMSQSTLMRAKDALKYGREVGKPGPHIYLVKKKSRNVIIMSNRFFLKIVTSLMKNLETRLVPNMLLFICSKNMHRY